MMDKYDIVKCCFDNVDEYGNKTYDIIISNGEPKVALIIEDYYIFEMDYCPHCGKKFEIIKRCDHE